MNATDRFATAPNLFLLGAMKCGTTSLYRYLEQHPNVYFPLNKEPQFFCNDELYAQGVEFYLERFFDRAGDFCIRADATPHYLYFEKSARRIAESLPEQSLRFIAIFRDPVARAYSHYWNTVREALEELSFEEALDAEAKRIQDPALAELGTLPYHYASAGMYARQLKPYLERFGRENFLLLFEEDLRDDPEAVMSTVFGFLGLEPASIDFSRVHNPAAAARSPRFQRWLRNSSYVKQRLGALLPYGLKYRITQSLLALNKKSFRYDPMDAATENKLRKRFLDDIADLEKITGRDLSAWKRGPRKQN